MTRPEVETFRGFNFDCFIDVAVNPVTKSQVELVEPVKIDSFEDFARFYDQWEQFCSDLHRSDCDPAEVCFRLE